MEITLIFNIEGIDVSHDFKESSTMRYISRKINKDKGVYSQDIFFEGTNILDWGELTRIRDTELAQQSRLICKNKNSDSQIKDFHEYKSLVGTNARDLIYVNHQTEDICLIAVKRDGLMISAIHDKTEKLCVAAVRQNPAALQLIENQTPFICLMAIMKDFTGRVFRYVKCQDKLICSIAVYRCPKNIKLIDKPSKRLCLLAIDRDPMMIDYIENVLKSMCILAARRDINILSKVEHQHIDLCKEVMRRDPTKLSQIRDSDVRQEMEEYIKLGKRSRKINFDGRQKVRDLITKIANSQAFSI